MILRFRRRVYRRIVKLDAPKSKIVGIASRFREINRTSLADADHCSANIQTASPSQILARVNEDTDRTAAAAHLRSLNADPATIATDRKIAVLAAGYADIYVSALSADSNGIIRDRQTTHRCILQSVENIEPAVRLRRRRVPTA